VFVLRTLVLHARGVPGPASLGTGTSAFSRNPDLKPRHVSFGNSKFALVTCRDIDKKNLVIRLVGETRVTFLGRLNQGLIVKHLTGCSLSGVINTAQRAPYSSPAFPGTLRSVLRGSSGGYPAGPPWFAPAVQLLILFVRRYRARTTLSLDRGQTLPVPIGAWGAKDQMTVIRTRRGV